MNRKLKSSRYLSPNQIETFGLEVKSELQSYKEDEQLQGFFVIIDFVYEQAQQDGQWSSLERRLNPFF